MGGEKERLQKERHFIPLPGLLRMAKDISGVTVEFLLVKIYLIHHHHHHHHHLHPQLMTP